MNCLPVIEMELRSAAQRRGTGRLRLFFALAGTAACGVVLSLPRLSAADKGRVMLVILSGLTLVFCLFAGGCLTADCVSREKREGTLGLLFLTPLSGLDIVLGKMVCHSLQMLYGVCAAIPVFFLPLFVGGVTGTEVCRILLALGLTMLLATAVGLLVSVLGVESRKTIMTTFSSLVLLAGLPMVALLGSRMFLRSHRAWDALAGLSPVFTVTYGFDSYYRTSLGRVGYWGSIVVLAGLSLALVLASGILLTRVFRTLGIGHESARASLRVASPGLTAVRERNPYEWVVLRGAGDCRRLGRVNGLLVVLFGMMLVVSVSTPYWREGFCSAFFTALAIHLVAKLRFAVEATRQIQSDRQSGALELLLVTPLPERQIIEGHHQGARALARKPLALLAGLNLALEACVVLFPEHLQMRHGAGRSFTVIFLGGICLAAADLGTLRWLALRHGLRAASHVKAALGAFGALMVIPWIGFGLMIAALTNANGSDSTVGVYFALWTLGALLYDALLIRRCRAGPQVNPGGDRGTA